MPPVRGIGIQDRFQFIGGERAGNPFVPLRQDLVFLDPDGPFGAGAAQWGQLKWTFGVVMATALLRG